MSAAFIVDAVRTPRARRKGKFTTVHPVDLLTYPLNALCNRTQLAPELMEDLLVGCVTQAQEQAWCVGRAAVLAAGWPISVPATTINRLCGSGLQALNFAAQGVLAGQYDLVVAAGLEHMTRVPMFSDGGGETSPLLLKHHADLVQQGESAEILAERFKISRVDADTFALRSQTNAKLALEQGKFSKSMIAVPYRDDQGVEQVLSRDDNPRPETTLEGLATLKTVFKPDGIITAGNASAIVDGAAAILVASEAALSQHSLKARARIVAQISIGSPPRIMLTGPIEASRQALKRAGLSVQQIDLWEINEAFAPVPIMTMRELGIDPERVNVNGGGISLGHPLGATGAMLIGMAIDELERRHERYAMVTMCIGLGMGIATILERV
ncbi:MAG: thiolase family protein [Proteobacteria bacterium]|nr:thiolase family protein [Pseudomonadota bacterium]